MKKRLVKWILRAGAIAGLPLLAISLVALLSPRGSFATGPVLVGGPLSNGYFFVTVTNGTLGGVYEIFEKYSLDANVPWSGSMTGGVGVTNFMKYVGPSVSWFFKAIATNDLDGDGIENSRDADPNNPTNNAALTITIVSPANGSNLN